MAYKKLKYWVDLELAEQLSSKITTVYSDFPKKAFVNYINERISDLELKPRIEVFADSFYLAFKSNYRKGLNVLMKILGPENENETGMFKEYYWIMPIAKYVEKYGLDDYKISLDAIQEITKRNTGEYAIRPFIEKYPQKTLKAILDWSKHANKHVRRLASEGVRPRLPGASKLQMFIDDPTPILPILQNLKDDSSKYVQKSVANCLNDILKDNPAIGKSVIENWITPSISEERQWIIKHAIRNLRKSEDTWALNIIKQL